MTISQRKLSLSSNNTDDLLNSDLKDGIVLSRSSSEQEDNILTVSQSRQATCKFVAESEMTLTKETMVDNHNHDAAQALQDFMLRGTFGQETELSHHKQTSTLADEFLNEIEDL